MKRILLLSDLWGTQDRDWVSRYTFVLEKNFQVQYHDGRELENVSMTESSKEKVHSQFVKGGIQWAVERLLMESGELDAILGFSIGGTIAWQACLSEFPAQSLFAVSSTRLRYPTLRPSTQIELFNGEKDPFRSKKAWFSKMKIQKNLYHDKDHDMYIEPEIGLDICT